MESLSFAKVLWEWRRERCPALIFLSLGTLLGMAAEPLLRPWGSVAFIATSLLSLRLLDDLWDVEYDRRHRSDRILGQQPRLRRFWSAAVLGSIVSGALLSVSGGYWLGAIWLFYTLCLGLWYYLRQYMSIGLIPHTLVLMSKYPSMVVCAGAASGATPRLVANALVIYGVMILNEGMTDSRFMPSLVGVTRRQRYLRPLLFFGALGLCMRGGFLW